MAISIPFDDVMEFDDAYEFALGQVAYYIKDLFPEKPVFRADRSLSVPTEPYVTIRPMTVGGMNPSDFGNESVQNFTASDGTLTQIYQHRLMVSIKCYKGSAVADATTLRKNLNKPVKHWEYFGKYKTVGIGSKSQVTNNPTPIDQQEMEAGATFNLGIYFLSKEVTLPEDGLGYILTAKGDINCLDRDGNTEITQEFDSDNASPSS